jgi:hypothetical protein
MAVVGAGVAMLEPGLRDGRLTHDARVLLSAVARAVLDGSLATEPSARQVALAAHLERLDTTLAGLPVPVRSEISELIALLNVPPGRLVIAGLRSPWSRAGVEEVQAAMQGMRRSSILMRRQVYQALRELTIAAYFADPAAWAALGYPGPRAIS